MLEQSKDLLCEVRGCIGVITLNRPKALNALSIDMVRSMRAFLNSVAVDSEAVGIVIQSSIPNVFCAGGDIKAAYALYQQRDYDALSRYIEEEYALNQAIARFPKPTVALVDGLTLGGGVGISRYTTYRVVTENAQIGMPEVKIAFFPDVGAGYFLNLLDASVAKFLAVTGHVLSGKDLLSTGYGTHAVVSQDLDALFNTFVNEGSISEGVIAQFSSQPYGESEIEQLKNVIACFEASTLQACLLDLKRVDPDLYQTFMRYSPLALQLIWQYMSVTRGRPYQEVVDVDLKLAKEMFHRSDFFEGIRTRLIDKGDTPAWKHQSIDDVNQALIDSFFD